MSQNTSYHTLLKARGWVVGGGGGGGEGGEEGRGKGGGTIEQRVESNECQSTKGDSLLATFVLKTSFLNKKPAKLPP